MSVNGTLFQPRFEKYRETQPRPRQTIKCSNSRKKIRKNFHNEKFRYVLNPNYEILSNNKLSLLIGQHFRLS